MNIIDKIEYPYKEHKDGRNGATTHSTPKKAKVLGIGANQNLTKSGA